MGQLPGTHWYHAHKHGSTAINVANGMTGAFIIEGQYDADLNDAQTGYGSYSLESGPWNTASQPVLVLNQLGTSQNALIRTGGDGRPEGVDFSVNGRIRPKLKMQPGEVQLWRIVNTSGRTAAYFMPPKGLKWRQLAQDGVQYANDRYLKSENKPFYMAPANRVDLLVQAPFEMAGMKADVHIQNVLARSQVKPNPDEPEPVNGIVLLTVEVTGEKVKQNGQPKQMEFLETAPKQPVFLKDIGDDELKQSNFITRTLVFNSKPSQSGPLQHTINDIQFDEGHAHLKIVLDATEEWTVKNTTNKEPGLGPNNSRIDHPLHIHINPFQVTEFFDPNEILVDDAGQAVLGDDGKPMWRYFITGEGTPDKRQCELDPKDPQTWREGGKIKEDGNAANDACVKQKEKKQKEKNLVWWDVFAIPGGRVPKDGNGDPLKDAAEQPIVIPGYFKMRSRFVDYPGLYVMHCHILIHEDRGMMFSVEVIRSQPAPVHH
jgi:FtsP/CotA-like multicopper oxidase with cupredoxin domain